MKDLKIGWIGLGYMGVPMAANLLKNGYKVSVHNRTQSKENQLIELGASSLKPLEIMQHCDLIFTMLSDDCAVRDVFEGESGLIQQAFKGKLIVNMSTISPAISNEMYEKCKAVGIDYLEAPVSGSVKPAQDGTLIILAGGEQSHFEKVKPLFEILGKLSLFLGNIGQGAYAKLAINYYLGVQVQSLAETILFAQQQNISKEDMLQIINEGACGSAISKIKTTSILKEEYPAAFPLKHLLKDIKLANQAGLGAPLMNPLLQSFVNAESKGLQEEDVMAIIKSL